MLHLLILKGAHHLRTSKNVLDALSLVSAWSQVQQEFGLAVKVLFQGHLHLVSEFLGSRSSSISNSNIELLYSQGGS